jgi:hypothetical protein
MTLVMTRRGQLPAEKLYVGTCSKCKSQYRAQQKDLTYESDYRESSYVHRCILTGCNTTVYFSEER